LESPTFQPHEFENRIARARELMLGCQLDGLLVTSPPNFRYFTGFETQFWESPTRAWFALTPTDGPCTAIIPEIGVPAVARTWIGALRSWPAPRPADDGISLVADALRSAPRRFGRVGLEMGRESAVRMPLIDFFALKDRLTGIDLVDGSPCLWQLRAIKSAAEIGYIKESCRIVSEAFEALPRSLETGRTEREICRDLTVDMFRRGIHAVPFIAAASGQGGYPEIISSPSDRPLADGDILIVDVGATVHGYFADFDRNLGFGKISNQALEAHDAVWQATEAGIRAAKPGATMSDLWSAMSVVLERAGSTRNNVGRMGHGLGLQLTEPPSAKADDHTVLEPGMVITIEPGMEYVDGKMIVHEENLVITDTGSELLTMRAPRELPRIPT